MVRRAEIAAVRLQRGRGMDGVRKLLATFGADRSRIQQDGPGDGNEPNGVTPEQDGLVASSFLASDKLPGADAGASTSAIVNSLVTSPSGLPCAALNRSRAGAATVGSDSKAAMKTFASKWMWLIGLVRTIRREANGHEP